MMRWKLEWKLWRNPGAAPSLVAHPPPTSSRASSTSTRRPAFARYAPEVSPLWPPPTMTTSLDPSAIRVVLLPQLFGLFPALGRLEVVGREVAGALEVMGRGSEGSSLDQALDVLAIDPVHLGVGE